MKITITVHHLPSGQIWASDEEGVDDGAFTEIKRVVEECTKQGFEMFSLITSEGEVYFNSKVMEESVITIKEK